MIFSSLGVGDSFLNDVDTLYNTSPNYYAKSKKSDSNHCLNRNSVNPIFTHKTKKRINVCVIFLTLIVGEVRTNFFTVGESGDMWKFCLWGRCGSGVNVDIV